MSAVYRPRLACPAPPPQLCFVRTKRVAFPPKVSPEVVSVLALEPWMFWSISTPCHPLVKIHHQRYIIKGTSSSSSPHDPQQRLAEAPHSPESSEFPLSMGTKALRKISCGQRRVGIVRRCLSDPVPCFDPEERNDEALHPSQRCTFPLSLGTDIPYQLIWYITN